MPSNVKLYTYYAVKISAELMVLFWIFWCKPKTEPKFSFTEFSALKILYPIPIAIFEKPKNWNRSLG